MNDISGEIESNGLDLYSEAEKPVETDVNGVPIIITPVGWKVHELRECMNVPQRIEAALKLVCIESFIRYVNTHKLPNSIIRISDSGTFKACATIDYHHEPAEDEGLAGWCRHKVWLEPRVTSAYLTWYENNGKAMSQSDFADFIYQNSIDIHDPKGADLLEIVKTLKATSSGVFKNMIDSHDGSMDLIMNVKVSAQGGTTDKPLHLPKQIKVMLQPFYGSSTMELTADLFFRIPKSDGEKLTIGYKLFRLDDTREQLGKDIEAELASQTQLPVYRSGAL